MADLWVLAEHPYGLRAKSGSNVVGVGQLCAAPQVKGFALQGLSGMAQHLVDAVETV